MEMKNQLLVTRRNAISDTTELIVLESTLEKIPRIWKLVSWFADIDMACLVGLKLTFFLNVCTYQLYINV